MNIFSSTLNFPFILYFFSSSLSVVCVFRSTSTLAYRICYIERQTLVCIGHNTAQMVERTLRDRDTQKGSQYINEYMLSCSYVYVIFSSSSFSFVFSSLLFGASLSNFKKRDAALTIIIMVPAFCICIYKYFVPNEMHKPLTNHDGSVWHWN